MDIILGMDWMKRHGVLLDISSRAVEINSPTHGHSVLYLPHSEHVISCAYAMKDIRLEDIPIVREYADVFLDDLPGKPPDQDIEFVIELQPGTAPISKRPYRMPPKELAELKIQLQELLDKGFIRPSASPWGCPALFVKNCTNATKHEFRVQWGGSGAFIAKNFDATSWHELLHQFGPFCTEFRKATKRLQMHPNSMKLIKFLV